MMCSPYVRVRFVKEYTVWASCSVKIVVCLRKTPSLTAIVPFDLQSWRVNYNIFTCIFLPEKVARYAID